VSTDGVGAPPGRGRRAAGSGTRDRILDAARAEFAERGYLAASVRAISRRAAVDPALVRHYFGAKSNLFAAANDIPAQPDGYRLALDFPDEPAILYGWRNPRSIFHDGAPTLRATPHKTGCGSHAELRGCLLPYCTAACRDSLLQYLRCAHAPRDKPYDYTIRTETSIERSLLTALPQCPALPAPNHNWDYYLAPR